MKKLFYPYLYYSLYVIKAASEVCFEEEEENS